jgi:hypothetical protein
MNIINNQHWESQMRLHDVFENMRLFEIYPKQI